MKTDSSIIFYNLISKELWKYADEAYWHWVNSSFQESDRFFDMKKTIKEFAQKWDEQFNPKEK